MQVPNIWFNQNFFFIGVNLNLIKLKGDLLWHIKKLVK